MNDILKVDGKYGNDGKVEVVGPDIRVEGNVIGKITKVEGDVVFLEIEDKYSDTFMHSGSFPMSVRIKSDTFINLGDD